MANMSYCRFENTVRDMHDCIRNIDADLDEGSFENSARKEFIKLCKQVAEDCRE